MLAAIVAALAVPVGFAPSLESTKIGTQARYTAAIPAASVAAVPTIAAAAVAASPSIIHLSGTPAPARHAVPDAAQLVCAGTVLFGLAALVRKTI